MSRAEGERLMMEPVLGETRCRIELLDDAQKLFRKAGCADRAADARRMARLYEEGWLDDESPAGLSFESAVMEEVRKRERDGSAAGAAAGAGAGERLQDSMLHADKATEDGALPGV